MKQIPIEAAYRQCEEWEVTSLHKEFLPAELQLCRYCRQFCILEHCPLQGHTCTHGMAASGHNELLGLKTGILDKLQISKSRCIPSSTVNFPLSLGQPWDEGLCFRGTASWAAYLQGGRWAPESVNWVGHIICVLTAGHIIPDWFSVAVWLLGRKMFLELQQAEFPRHTCSQNVPVSTKWKSFD